MTFGPWTRGDVLDLCILLLLVIWLTLDRSNIYFTDIWKFVSRFRTKPSAEYSRSGGARRT
jgi:hypothetical protein